MSPRHSVIELNGHKFDAHTGAPLDQPAPRKPAMTDIIKAPRTARTTTHSKHVHRSPAKGKTLMRHVVKKPDISKAVADGVIHRPQRTAAEMPRALFHGSPDTVRTKRAAHIKQSNLITRFGDIMNTPVRMPVLSANGSKKHLIHQMDVTPAPTAPVNTEAPPPALKKHASHDIAEKGLRAATSHVKTKPRKQRLHHRIGRKLGLRPKVASFVAGSAALLALGGFIAYQNVPDLAVQYASMKAGVDASLPSYQPSGFAINDRVHYSPGEVAVAYKANADERSYTLTQKSSAWNNDSLKDYVATTSGQEPQSYPENGKTIYLYGDSEAAWVDGGVLYRISGDSELNAEQLIKIAKSL